MKNALMLAASLLFLAPAAARAGDCGHWVRCGERRVWVRDRVVVVERPCPPRVIVVPRREVCVRIVHPIPLRIVCR